MIKLVNLSIQVEGFNVSQLMISIYLILVLLVIIERAQPKYFLLVVTFENFERETFRSINVILRN